MGLNADLSFGIALMSGFASFLSPCLLPMIPAYVIYMAGSSAAEEGKILRRAAVLRTLAFVMGFTLIFMLMGFSAGAAGHFFVSHKMAFQRVGGLFIVILGLHFLGVFRIESLLKSRTLKIPFKGNSFWGALLMGLAFGAGWTPCFGPVLGAILVMASTGSSTLQGGLLLLAYALGMGIPFILTAFFINEVTPIFSKYSGKGVWVEKAAGGILVIFGILMALNWLVKLNVLL